MTAVMIKGWQFIHADAVSWRELIQALDAVMLAKSPRCRPSEAGEFGWHGCRFPRELQEALLVEFLLEAFDLSFELLVLARDQLGLEDDLPAMAHQGRTHSCAGATPLPDCRRTADSIVSTVTPASRSSSIAAMASVCRC